MKPFKFGSLTIVPAEYGSHGNAVLGIRGSGKSYTATAIAERLFDAGIPFIAFDPVGIWRHLRVPGDGKGYPIVVAGGKDGDLPLTVAGAPAIVRAAMQGGISLVIDLFDINLSKADWRRIVTAAVRTLMHENHAYGLRHVFIEEAAEFIPQKPIDWDVYAEIEKLARMGGNSRLGYTLINQRSQEVSKAILELCENVFLHRQRGKNALENMDKWLQVAGATEQKEIIKTLPDLPQGHCWAWLGGDHPTPPTLIKVPAKNSFHPDRRVVRGDTVATKAKPVDVGQFVEGMRGQLEKIVEQAKADDPATLKAEIGRLKGELAKKVVGAPVVDTAAIEAARQEGRQHSERAHRPLLIVADIATRRLGAIIDEATELRRQVWEAVDEVKAAPAPTPGITHTRQPFSPAPTSALPVSTSQAAKASTGLSRPQQRILDALAWLESIGIGQADRTRVAMLADASPKSSGFEKNVSTLSSKGLVAYPVPGTLKLTEAGRAAANAPATLPTNADLHAAIRSKISGPQWALLEALIRQRVPLSRAELAEQAGVSAASSGFEKNVSTLSGFGFVTYPERGYVQVADIMFVER